MKPSAQQLLKSFPLYYKVHTEHKFTIDYVGFIELEPSASVKCLNQYLKKPMVLIWKWIACLLQVGGELLHHVEDFKYSVS